MDEDTLHLWHLELQLDDFGYRWYLDSAFPDSNDPSVWTDLTAVYGVSHFRWRQRRQAVLDRDV